MNSTTESLGDTTTDATTADTLVMAAVSKLLSVASSGSPSWGSVFKILFLVLALVNIKNIPLTWHFRFYRSLFHHLMRRRSIHPTPSHLFSPITSTSRSPLYECDLNMHKSNSTYFSDLDIARTHLVCHLIKRSLRSRRQLYIALAGVTCLFRREIKPFEKYEIVSRVLGWDEKWVWVVSHFVQIGGKLETPKDGGRPQRKIFASALSKYVFKMGRVTVKPEEIFTECKLLPPRPAATADSTGVQMNGNGSANGNGAAKRNGTAKLSEKQLLEQLDEAAAAATVPGAEETDAYWTWDRVEEERARGYKVAQYMLGLDPLDGEIRSGEEEGLMKIGRFY